MKEESFTIDTVPLNAPSLSSLKNKKILLPETPCDNCFNKELECEKNKIACPDFRHYINKGIIKDENRIPTKETYLKINNLKIEDITKKENKIHIVEQGTTLQKELKLLNKLRIRSLEEIESYFEDSTTLEKAKLACIVYGLVLRSDIIGCEEK